MKRDSISHLTVDATENMENKTQPSHYEIVKRERVYSGFYQLEKMILRHELFKGGTSKDLIRELVVRLEGVCVLLFDPINDLYLFVEQFRVGALGEDRAWLFELVAGLIDKDERPDEVARREALEEAGVVLGKMKFITKYFPSPGGSQEKVYLYVAEASLEGIDGTLHGLAEEGEDIKVHVMPCDTAYALMAKGKMNNPAALIALMWMQLNKKNLLEEWE
jgi:ADP-ribose pyrophosphatase